MSKYEPRSRGYQLNPFPLFKFLTLELFYYFSKIPMKKKTGTSTRPFEEYRSNNQVLNKHLISYVHKMNGVISSTKIIFRKRIMRKVNEQMSE